MTGWNLQRKLAACIDLLVERHPQGLRVLVGECPPPTSEEIRLMYEDPGEDPGVRIDGGESVPLAERQAICAERFDEVIRAAGGWPHITATTREWSVCYGTTWDIVVDHVRFVGTGDFTKIDQSQLARVAERHGVHKDTVWRRRRDFPELLASCILKAPSAEYFELRTQ